MSELFRAEVLDVAPRQARIALSLASAEAMRFWNTRSFGLWLLLEPIFLGAAEAKTVSESVPTDAITNWDLARLRTLSSKLVTSVTIERVEPSVPEHLERLRGMQTGEEIERYFTAGGAPRATLLIRTRREGVTDHLRAGLQWRSAACDMG